MNGPEIPSEPGQEISAEHVEQLASADAGDYWWYAVRRAHVEAALRAGLGDGPCDYLDFGCGTGGVLGWVEQTFAPRRSHGLDGTRQAVELAVRRGLPAAYADFRQPLALPFAPTAITCLDVLEHLEDPVLALDHLARSASTDALLVVTVPAMPSLHSAWDDLCGHFRRYTPSTLRADLQAGGWQVARLRHVFSFCVPPAWWQRRVTRKVQEVEFPPVSPLVNRLMTTAGRIERQLGSPFPFGTSLVATARRA